ncbi:unnamed protein product [Ranitomeya imitator]|uniref:TLC domain-containing protein n=1 Tax=Ranitomeya imitator TaxID=111125 RepID=A0ABN9LX00_9NEOB|nr:unnamed protein product [Ranitomeya imitator]
MPTRLLSFSQFSSIESSRVISCFSISMLLHRYVGFAVVALLVEINSIFLHLRQVLLMANLVKTTVYRLNSLLNLGTYVIFRISTLAWMTRWLVLNRENIPLLIYTIGSVGMAIMTLMNIVLFYRLLRSDFLKSARDTVTSLHYCSSEETKRKIVQGFAHLLTSCSKEKSLFDLEAFLLGENISVSMASDISLYGSILRRTYK